MSTHLHYNWGCFFVLLFIFVSLQFCLSERDCWGQGPSFFLQPVDDPAEKAGMSPWRHSQDAKKYIILPGSAVTFSGEIIMF